MRFQHEEVLFSKEEVASTKKDSEIVEEKRIFNYISFNGKWTF